MILRLILLFFLWLLIRRLWRTYLMPRERSGEMRPRYPGRESERSQNQPENMADLTQQKISEAEFEELDD